MANVELDARVTELEENGGGGSTQNRNKLNSDILLVYSVFQTQSNANYLQSNNNVVCLLL